MAGIVAATKAGDSFTQQTFEYLAVANNCQLVDQAGTITLASKPCVDTFNFYVDLIRTASVQGAQDATTTRAAYLAGKAAMIIWSSYLLDELAGLSSDARPTCPQCHRDPSFLADHSGIVTAITGPDGTQPSQFGELTSFAITKDANKDAAKLVEFMMIDGYLDWLALAPEGKVPVRTGTTDQPSKFTDAWNHLKTGAENREPLSEVYPPSVLKELATSPDTMNRWGFPQGQGRLVGAQLAELPIPKALAAALNGTLTRPLRPSRPRPTWKRSHRRSTRGEPTTHQAHGLGRRTRGGVRILRPDGNAVNAQRCCEIRDLHRATHPAAAGSTTAGTVVKGTGAHVSDLSQPNDWAYPARARNSLPNSA